MTISFNIYHKVYKLFEKIQLLWASEIAKKLSISRTTVHLTIKELIKEKKIKKIWKWPHVRYKFIIKNQFKIKSQIIDGYIPDYSTKKILNKIFFKFSPEGRKLEWFEGIKEWCEVRSLDLKEKCENYIKIHNHITKTYSNCDLIEVWEIFWKHFDWIYMDKVFYSDQYKWMEFGRGLLAEKTFYAKQSQNKELINESIDLIIDKLECIIQHEKCDAIAITPWSIDRKNQLLSFLWERLEFLWLPFVNIIKYYPNGIAIPQKSLKTREQRISNAKNTIFIDDDNIKKYKKVFLIDDFVWSGATLNETAKKLKEKGVQDVLWFAFVWNMNLTYEVINEI